MDYGRTVEEAVKIWLSLGGLILALLWGWLPRRVAVTLLVVIVSAAGLNYMRLGFARFTRVDSYDLMHYYLNARYFHELGYYDLYPAAILADAENGPFNPQIRRFRYQTREEGYRLRPLREGLERGREVRQERFTEERWAAFERDFLYLQRETHLPPIRFNDFVRDRGFNGTPVWVLLAMPFANLVPARAIRAVCLLDVLWLIVALIVIGFAYGRITSAWCVLFFLTTYAWRCAVPGAVFLRHDWICALMIAMALAKMGRPFWAGALTGLSGLLRFFPAAWMFGPVARALAMAWHARRVDLKDFRKPAIMVGGFVAAIVVLEGAAAGVLGTDAVEAHAENIVDHISAGELTSRRVGFAIAYGHEWELLPRFISEERKQEIAEQRNARLVITAFALLLLAWGLRRSPIDEAFGFGFIPFFMLATASYYYFSVRVMLIVVHAADPSKWRNRVGLAMLFGFEVFSNWTETNYPGHRVFLVGGLSQGLTLYAAVMIVWLVYEAIQADKRSKAEHEAATEDDQYPGSTQPEHEAETDDDQVPGSTQPEHEAATDDDQESESTQTEHEAPTDDDQESESTQAEPEATTARKTPEADEEGGASPDAEK